MPRKNSPLYQPPTQTLIFGGEEIPEEKKEDEQLVQKEPTRDRNQRVFEFGSSEEDTQPILIGYFD